MDRATINTSQIGVGMTQVALVGAMGIEAGTGRRHRVTGQAGRYPLDQFLEWV